MPDTIMPRPKIFPPAVGDHCYLRHGDRTLMARVFMPRGDTGPFPCLIDLHGGGWQGGDLEDRKGLGRYAGHVGCVIVALNFRHGADAYPSSLVDINYGIRWVKANTSARVRQHIFNKSSTYGIRRKRVSRLGGFGVCSTASPRSPRNQHPLPAFGTAQQPRPVRR